ncbi:cytochrome P450 [Phaeosphaeria sp. MPI-PUGE-AT-0046c]|nr:cytochrome P450 [Phaeosphaeria sp. MPI-PUGE-AT-0046c]
MLNAYLSSTLPGIGEKSALNVLVAGVVLYTLSTTILCFARNYIAARRIGLKIIISPITPYTLQWRLVASILERVLVRFRWYRAIDWTCAWQDGNTLHKELGDCFIVVSPGLNVVCTSDPKTIEHVLKDWRAFVKPDNVNEILGTFGHNVDTSNGDDWPRHRKIVAPCFSERASATVWGEAVTQSDSLLKKWLDSDSATVVQDTGMLALNVISAVAFENQNVNAPTAGHVLSLHDSLTTVMSTGISPALEGIMPWLDVPVLRRLMPGSIKKLMLACDEFRAYTTELLNHHQGSHIDASSSNLNLINTLIKANSVDARSRLSKSELRGNVFIFTVGGLESTSATLSFALALLAIHPQVQEWVREEVDEVLSGKELNSLEYKDIFPRLKRVLAVMFETLRLYSPSPPLPRSFHNKNAAFSIPTSDKGKEIVYLGPRTQIMMNSWASHASLNISNSSPSMEFDPARWLQSTSLSHNTPGFYPWGSGPRICPGMKFSQVEFCAVIVSVLARCKLSADRGEVEKGLGGSRADPLLLGMRGEVGVMVVGRS